MAAPRPLRRPEPLIPVTHPTASNPNSTDPSPTSGGSSTRIRAIRWLLLAPLLLVPVVSTVSRSGEPASTTPAVGAATLASALDTQPERGGFRGDEVAYFEARLAENPDDALARRRLAAVHQMRFRAYGDAGEVERSAALLDGLVAADPRDAGLLSLRTSSALATHDFRGALNAAQARLSAGDPSATDADLGLFDALWAAGHYVDARRLLEATRDEGESMARLSREARLLDGMGDVRAAASRMGRVVELTDAYAESPVVRAWARAEHGNFLLHSGEPEGAVIRFEEALALVPAYPAALEGLGAIAYGVDGTLGAAEALFEAALRYGHHLDLYPVLAEIAAARGDDERAADLERTFLLEATATPARERLYRRPLALLLAERPDGLDRALEYAEADLAARQDRMAWATRGWVLHRMGRHEEAVADAERALAWGSPEPEVLYRSGLIMLAAGDRKGATPLLNEALTGRAELGPVTSAMIEGRLGR